MSVTQTPDHPTAPVMVTTSTGLRVVKPRSGNDPYQIDFPLSIHNRRPDETTQISVIFDKARNRWDVAAYLSPRASTMPAAHALDFVTNLVRASQLADKLTVGE